MTTETEPFENHVFAADKDWPLQQAVDEYKLLGYVTPISGDATTIANDPTPPAPVPAQLNPECRAGKCGNCNGAALHEYTDEFVNCECSCHRRFSD